MQADFARSVIGDGSQHKGIAIIGVVQRGQQQVNGFRVQMIAVAGFCVQAFQHIGGGSDGNTAALDTEMVATAMNGDIQTLFDQLEVLMELSREGAQAAGIIGLQRQLAPGNIILGVQAGSAR
jgi:hypothetical protein